MKFSSKQTQKTPQNQSTQMMSQTPALSISNSKFTFTFNINPSETNKETNQKLIKDVIKTIQESGFFDHLKIDYSELKTKLETMIQDSKEKEGVIDELKEDLIDLDKAISGFVKVVQGFSEVPKEKNPELVNSNKKVVGDVIKAIQELSGGSFDVSKVDLSELKTKTDAIYQDASNNGVIITNQDLLDIHDAIVSIPKSLYTGEVIAHDEREAGDTKEHLNEAEMIKTIEELKAQLKHSDDEKKQYMKCFQRRTDEAADYYVRLEALQTKHIQQTDDYAKETSKLKDLQNKFDESAANVILLQNEVDDLKEFETKCQEMRMAYLEIGKADKAMDRAALTRSDARKKMEILVADSDSLFHPVRNNVKSEVVLGFISGKSAYQPRKEGFEQGLIGYIYPVDVEEASEDI